MKPMAVSKILSVVTCLLLFGASASTKALADQAQYIYDELGRS